MDYPNLNFGVNILGLRPHAENLDKNCSNPLNPTKADYNT